MPATSHPASTPPVGIAIGRPPTTQAGVVDAITAQMVTGHLRAGQALPTVRELAEQFSVDPGTVVRACRILVERGLARREGLSTRSRLLLNPPPLAILPGALVIISAHVPGPLPQEPGWNILEFVGALGHASARRRPVLAIHPDEAHPDQIAHWKANGVAGIIALGEKLEPAEPALAHAIATGIPVAIHAPKLTHLACDRADSDHHVGGYLLAKHLIASGRRRLATIWSWTAGIHPQHFAWSRARLSGIAQACREATLAAPACHVWEKSAHDVRALDITTACAHLPEILAGPGFCDALLMHTDGDVPWLITALRKLGKDIHRDVSVAGYDHYWHPDAGEGPCATIDKRNSEVGAALADMVLERLAGLSSPEPRQRLITPRLIVQKPSFHDSLTA